MDVSVIIVNYNTKDLTLKCIESIFQYTENVVFEVILVDNASIDGSKDIFSKDNRIIYIYNDENLGFGQANNKGANFATGKYLFFLNSDTYLLNNAIYYFKEYWDSHSKQSIGALGSILLNEQECPIHSSGLFPKIGRMLVSYTKFYFVKYMPPQLFHEDKVEYITGADLFISNDNFKLVGEFHPSFFMYYEETYLQWKLCELGMERIIINTPRIVHLEGASYTNRQQTRRRRIQMDKSLFIYWDLCYSPIKSFTNKIIYIFHRIPSLFSPNYKIKENIQYVKSLIAHLVNCRND